MPRRLNSSVEIYTPLLHLPNAVWQVRCKRSIVIIEPSIAFPPSVLLLTPKLFAKVFTNKRVGIQIAGVVRIFPG